MKDKCIKIKYDDKEEIFYKLKDAAKKYNTTSQHISGILNGKTKHKFFVYNEKLVYLEYVSLNNDQIDKYKMQQIESKKLYNKRAYEKRKNDKNISNEKINKNAKD
jgi:hypothetical protein